MTSYRVIIITGASDGLGRAIALELASPKTSLVLAARSENKLHAVAELCRQQGADVLVLPTDVGKQEACEALIEQTIANLGKIDMLVNNAALSIEGRFEDYTDLTPFHDVMQVNYFGSLYCTHYALPYLKKTRGRIVVVDSLSGKFGLPLETGYVASKHALSGFFNALRIELAKTGVSITIAYPGFVDTKARENSIGPDGKALGEGKKMPDGAMSAEDCARLIINTAEKRKRETIMTSGGKLGLWVQLLAPSLLDKIVQRYINQFA